MQSSRLMSILGVLRVSWLFLGNWSWNASLANINLSTAPSFRYLQLLWWSSAPVPLLLVFQGVLHFAEVEILARAPLEDIKHVLKRWKLMDDSYTASPLVVDSPRDTDLPGRSSRSGTWRRKTWRRKVGCHSRSPPGRTRHSPARAGSGGESTVQSARFWYM